MEILDFSGEPTFGDGMVVLAILQVQIPLEKRQSLILVLIIFRTKLYLSV